jgi:hypothetical protein
MNQAYEIVAPCLIASIVFLVLGWMTGLAFLSVIGCLLLIPFGIAALASLLWMIITR